jgi:hypothetical protein
MKKEMKKVKLFITKDSTPYRGLLFSAIRYVDGEFYNYEDLPDRAVLVAKHGSRFLNLNLGPFSNRKRWWVELVAAPPEDREELDLPREYGGSLELPTVVLTTTRSKKWFLVVSEEVWYNQREEVKEFLLEAGYAISEEKTRGDGFYPHSRGRP